MYSPDRAKQIKFTKEKLKKDGIKYYYEPESGILANGRYLQVGDDQWMYFKQDGSLAIGQVRASI